MTDLDKLIAAVEALRKERDDALNRISKLQSRLLSDSEKVMEWSADRDRLAAANAALEEQVARLVGALGRAQRALKPFADRVFDDNGDCTVSDTHTLTLPDYCNAKNAERIVCAALAEVQADARREGGE
jgi:hypothetical protein